MPPKNKRQLAAIKCWQKRAVKNEVKTNKSRFVSGWPRTAPTQDPPLPESSTVHNLTGPLLEVLKEEDPLPLVPPVTRQPLSEVLLVIEEPNPEPTNPTGADPIPEVARFCSLCLRPCTSDQVVEFSAEPSWNCLDVASGRDKLALLLGVEMELEQCAVCRSCWTMLETFVDFREGCLKAAAWRARFSFGLDEVGDDWLSKDQLEAMQWTRKVVQEHVECIEMAEVEARNRQDSGANELPEEKPGLEDEQDWVEDASCPDSPEERLNETAEIVEKMEITGFSCAKCKRKFETKAGASIHFEYCKKPPRKKPLAAKLHTCSVCSANFTQAYRLEEHLNRHSGIKPYVCRKGICNKPMYGKCQRRKHEKMCKGVDSSNPNDTPEALDVDIASLKKQQEKTIYSCENCPRRFDTEGGLKNHASRCNERVERRKFHTCEICSMEFLYPQTLEAHMNKHNGIKPYKCKNESCSKHFYGKGELYRHTTLCGKDKPICPLCGVQLSSKGTLKAHMETHVEEPVAGCDTCDLEQESTSNDREPPQSNNLPEEPEFLLEIKEERLEEVFDPVRSSGSSHNSEPPTLFCSLCLRQCSEEQIQELSTYQSWNGASFEDRRGKLEQMLGGVQIDGDICQTCWLMVELAVDFRQSCLKMVELKESFPVGVARKDGEEEEWFAGGHLEGLGRTRKMVQDHVERVEFAEASLRNEIDMKLEEGSGDDTTVIEKDTHLAENHFEEDLKSNSNESTENVEEPDDEPDLTPAEPIPIPLFTCSTCNRSFESKGSLHIHQNYCNSSKTIRTYSCTICSANFMCYASLIGHLNKHKGVKPFQCSKPSCTKTFYSRVVWRNHELSCGASPFVCALCGVTIKSYSAFKSHKAKHTERTFSCPNCEKKFSSRTHLRKHQTVHTNARNYPCTECDKAFKSSYAARVHMRIHTQEKPFSCAICGMGFAYKCLVKPHMEKSHEGAVYSKNESGKGQ